MAKLSAEETKRLDELKIIVYGKIAKKIILGKEDDHILSGSDIESHGGRVNKAIRLLTDAGVITYQGTSNSNKYTPAIDYAVRTFEKDSEGYGSIPDFKSKWEELHDHTYERARYITEIAGYCTITLNDSSYRNEQISLREAIYIYWHRDAYIITKDDEVYPRALEDTRQIAILRGVIEHTVFESYSRRLEKYLGLSKNNLKDNVLFGVSVRNFASTPMFMQDSFIQGKNSLEDEYRHNMEYFQAVYAYFQKLNNLITDVGGPAAIIERMRKEVIEELRLNAPRWLNAKVPEDIDDMSVSSSKYTVAKEIQVNKNVAGFIVSYGNFFSYDTIYKDDVSVKYIKEGSISEGLAYPEEIEFIPNKDELNFIDGYKHSPSSNDNCISSLYQIKVNRENRSMLYETPLI